MNKNVSRKSAVDEDVSRMHSVDKDVSRKCSVLTDAGMDKQRVLLRRRVAVAWVLAVVQLLLSWVVPSWTIQALIAAFVLFCLGRSFFVQACRQLVRGSWVLAVVQLLLSWVVPSWTIQALIAAFVLFCLGRSFFVQACRQLVRGRAGLDVLVVLSMTVAYFFSLFCWAAPAFAQGPGAGSLPSYLEIISPSYLRIISLPSFEIVSVMVAAFLTGRWMEACGQGRFSVTLTDRITFEIVSVMVAAFLTGRWMEACGQGRFSVTLTDRITNIYVPVVLMVAVLAFVGWSLCGQMGDGILAAVSVVIMACPCALGVAVPTALWMGLMVAVLAFVGWSLCGQMGDGILAAVSVVIMACPCALGVAVPTALWMGMAKFSRLRVRVNHAVGLQRLGKADVVVLDKTGTLTEGCSTVTGWLWSHSEESSCKDVLLAAVLVRWEWQCRLPCGWGWQSSPACG